MNEPIINYPEEMTTPTYFNQGIYKTKVAWISWALLFGTMALLSTLAINHDKYDGVIFLFFIGFFFLSIWFSIGGFKDGIKSVQKKEEVGNLRIGLIIANLSIFGSIIIGLSILIIGNLMY